MTSERDRMRREMRAMAAVNRQLQAWSEESVGVRRVRRAAQGPGWIEELLAMGASDPFLARAPNGAVFVVEGDRKRPVNSGILAAALEQLVGAPREASDDELEAWTEWVPVELLEGTSGVPFIVLGGRRHDVTGVPLPYAVDNLNAAEFPEGEPINVASANISRRRFEEALTGEFQISRARTALASKGPMGTTKAIARKVQGRVRRAMSR
jgi:hypothetical protein